jgi:hypothetical protein
MRARDQEREEHVKPADGKEARRLRREAQRESRRTRSESVAQEVPEPRLVQPMLPRTPPRRRRARDRDREQTRRSERVRPRGMVWMSWRWVSGTLSISLLVLLIGLLSSSAFYVSSVSVGGVNYLTREEVFQFSDVSQKHIFWVDAEAVEARLESNNNIAEAEVRVGWPPGLVQILVRERDPAIVWEQNTQRVWVDINGQAMFQREDRPDLLRIVYDPNETQPEATIGPDTYLSTEIVHGALLLKSRLPSIDVLLYHPVKGLGWRDPRGWMVWFGIGDNMAMKARVYESLVATNIDQLQFGEVDVSDPDNPVYTVLWRRSSGE